MHRCQKFLLLPTWTVSAELSKQGLKRSRAGARHVCSFTSVAALARTPELTTITRSVLDDDALPFRATFFDKSPNSNWLVACQDRALPLTSRKEIPGWGPWSTKDSVAYAHAHVEALEQILALRVHLDDSTIENGPLRVIPDSQKIGVLTDQEFRNASAAL
jgi:Phytanoyl-CoA dioxygenase (PhyH)